MQSDFYIENRKKYTNLIKNNSLTILFAGCPPHRSQDEDYPFVVNRNFYYLTGLNRQNFVLLLVKDEKVNEHLFIEKPDPHLALWIGDRMTKEEASKICGICIESIHYLDEFESYLNVFIQGRGRTLSHDKIYFDLEKESFKSVDSYANRFAKDLISRYPYINVYNAYSLIANLRLYKEECEILAIKKAIDITNLGFKELMKNAHPKMMEYELEAYFDYIVKYNNTEVSFKTIAASGERATTLHYSDNNSMMEDNDLILFDFGAQSNLYCADISRTFPVNGCFTKRQREIYEIVLEANKKSIENLKPGLTWQEFNQFGEKILADGLIKIGLIKEPSEIRKYYYHSLGHPLGLDTHDVGSYAMPIKEGVVVTVEPGLYIKEEKIGIRIEDDVLVTKDGAICLSKDIIKEVDEIEQFMKKENIYLKK